MKKLLLVIVILAFFPIMPVLAVTVSSLYQAEVPVVTQADNERSEAVKQGFVRVLIKLSGDSQIDNNPIIKSSLKKADYYVQEFSYATPTVSSSQYLLQIRYNTADVNKLLNKAGVTYWGESRPLILVWLAVTNNAVHTSQIISNEESGDILLAMKQKEKKYGLPLIFPMMDITDMDQVSYDDIAAMNLPALQEAARRYSPDAFLIGAIQQNDDVFQGEWQLVIGDNQWHWSISDKSIENVIDSVLNQTSQTLAKRLAFQNTSDRFYDAKIIGSINTGP